jgi:hypothetical protein
VGSGANAIAVGSGAHAIQVESGARAIQVGSGVDAIAVGSGAHAIQVGSGARAIQVGSGVDAIAVGSGVHAIQVGSGARAIQVGSGVDAIAVGSGAHAIQVGSGVEAIAVGSGVHAIQVGSGVYAIQVGSGVDAIAVGSGVKDVDAESVIELFAPVDAVIGSQFLSVLGQAVDLGALPANVSGLFSQGQMTYLQGVIGDDGNFVALNALVYPQPHIAGATEVLVAGPIQSVDNMTGTAVIGGFSVDMTPTLGQVQLPSVSVGDRFAAYGSAYPGTNVSVFASAISELE